METKDLADNIFSGMRARCILEDEFMEPHSELHDFKFGFDDYDGSLEIYGVPEDFRLNEHSYNLFKDTGFCIVFVNHSPIGEDRNKYWQTHYTFSIGKSYQDYWRVNYKEKLCNEKEETPIDIDEYFSKRK